MDIIKQLKDELSDAKKEDTTMQKKKMDQEEANKQIVEPLQKANEELKSLTKKKLTHNKIMGSLEECQHHIMEQDTILKDIEWQYEVRLQQYQYLEREKQELFDQFQQTVYEIH